MCPLQAGLTWLFQLSHTSDDDCTPQHTYLYVYALPTSRLTDCCRDVVFVFRDFRSPGVKVCARSHFAPGFYLHISFIVCSRSIVLTNHSNISTQLLASHNTARQRGLPLSYISRSPASSRHRNLTNTSLPQPSSDRKSKAPPKYMA